MSQLKARCIDQVLTFENTPVITSGDVNYDSITFDFCSAWDGFTKTAIFYRSENEVYYQLLDEANTCIIPREVLTTKGVIHIGVFGVMDDITLTSQVLTYRIAQGAITENLKPADPTPDIYAQIISRYDRIIDELDRQFEKLEDLQSQFDGSVGNANQLDGHDADYFATAESVEALKNGTTPAGKAEDSNKLGGHGADYFFPKSGGIINGSISVKSEEVINIYSYIRNAVRNVFQYINANGGYTLYDDTNKKSILESRADGTNIFNGVANGNLPLTGGTIEGDLLLKSSEAKQVEHRLKNTVRNIGLVIRSNGSATLYDTTNNKSILDSTADGTNTFNGTASGNLPITGGTVSGTVVFSKGNENVGYGRIHQDHNTVANYGLTLRDYDAEGNFVGVRISSTDDKVYYRAKDTYNKEILHTGNSARVHIGDTAPNDTTGNVLFINTSS